MAERTATADRAAPLLWFLLMGLSFAQRPGETTFDTKFDLTADPGAFLERTLHLWNPQLSFGELQNQAYGYLFPQGPFFWLAENVGLPDWVAQRLWSGLLLVVAFEGARRLFRALTRDEVSSGIPEILAGLAFALSPRLLGLVGVLSAEVLPTAVLPWAVLPLVLAQRGALSPRLGGLLSGLAVLGMGGVNAVENLAALPLPAMIVLLGWRRTDGRRLAGWWVLGTTLACVWWFLPLLFLGAYSPPFLDYIETAATTTGPLGWTNVTRGADHWVAFVQVGGQRWWPGAYELSTGPWLIGITAIVAAISLVGLFHRRMPARSPLALTALLGMFLLAVAHASPLASPLGEPLRTLLDEALAPLRNVHKVDPLVRLPLALGFGHVAVMLAAWAARRRRGSSWLRTAVPTGLVAVLLASAQPALAGELRRPGWSEVPRAWHLAADYLAEHTDGRRALVLPGSGFGQQNWGWTIDEPIQGLASSPWVARTQVPLVPGQTIRFLDSLGERVQDGRGSSALADALARSGISHVVVRRDLDLFATDAPSPARIDQALALSPQLSKVASFGDGAIDILRVNRPVREVQAVLSEEVVTLAGGPDDLITLLEAEALDGDRPVVIEGEPGWDEPADLVGDGYRLRERQFGRLQDSLGQLMALGEPFRIDRAVHDYPGTPGVPRVHAEYTAVESLDASSSSGYADSLGAIRPELGPYAAVDGVPDTYWRSAPLERPRGQWLEVRLREPQPLSRLDLVVGVDRISGEPVRAVAVDVDGRRSEHTVDPVSGVVRVPLTGAPVQRIRVTVTSVEGNPDHGVVVIREIGLPGLPLGRSVVVPSEASGDAAFVFRAQPHRRACLSGWGPLTCEPDQARPGEEESGMHRTFTTDSAGTWRMSGRVVARTSEEARELLLPLGSAAAVTASSVLAGDPAVSGQFALDGDPLTPWLSQRGDREPSLELSWDRPRTLSRLQVRGALVASRAPTEAVLRTENEVRRIDLGPGSVGAFAPLRTDSVSITFPMGEAAGDADRAPVGVGELEIDGLENLAFAPAPDGPTGAACGLGPALTIDGRELRTRVRGTRGDVRTGTALDLEVCGEELLHLPAGRHRLELPSTDRFAPSLLTLEPESVGGTKESVATRTTEVRSWSARRRSVFVGPGDEALLRIPENVNAGWEARLEGRRLPSTRIDGWQQAFRVPAGEGGLVTITYLPDTPYRISLLVGAGAAALLLLLTLLVGWRERRRPVTSVPAEGESALALGTIGLVAVPVIALLAGGIAPAAGVLLGYLAGQSRPRLLLLGGAAAVALAGIAAGIAAGLADPGQVLLSRQVLDAVAGCGVGLLMATLVRRRTADV